MRAKSIGARVLGQAQELVEIDAAPRGRSADAPDRCGLGSRPTSAHRAPPAYGERRGRRSAGRSPRPRRCRETCRAAPRPASPIRRGTCSNGTGGRRCRPSAISSAVPKPNMSAPSIDAITTSRPVLKPPSTGAADAPRASRWLPACDASSTRPSSHGNPPCLIEPSGDAPVPRRGRRCGRHRRALSPRRSRRSRMPDCATSLTAIFAFAFARRRS